MISSVTFCVKARPQLDSCGSTNCKISCRGQRTIDMSFDLLFGRERRDNSDVPSSSEIGQGFEKHPRLVPQMHRFLTVNHFLKLFSEKYTTPLSNFL